MKLGKRLKAIADMVEHDSVLCDIGTDHGYLAVYLVEKGICKKMFASDINAGPLENAKKAVQLAKLTKEITLRLGGGLEPYNKGEVDSAVIAGMGGELMIQILEDRMDLVRKMKYLILQPQNSQDEVRKWLEKNKFAIVAETLEEESGKYYQILKIVNGTMKIEDPLQYELGVMLLKKGDVLSKTYLTHLIDKNETIMTRMSMSEDDKALNAKNLLKEKNDSMKKVLACL